MKHFLYIIVLLLVSTWSNAQPVWCWAEDALSNNNEIFLDIATESTTGISYAVGFFNDDLSLEYTLGYNNTPDMSIPLGNQDGLVAKYDQSGNVIWAFKIGNPGDEVSISGVEIGASGNIFITGYFDDACEFQGVSTSATSFVTSMDKQDAFLASYDSDGNFLWVVTGRNTGDSQGLDVDVNSTNVYITGWFENSITFSGASVAVNYYDGLDAYVVAYDQSGTYLWQGHIADNTLNNEDDIGHGIAADDNDVYVTGVYERSFDVNGSFAMTALTPGITSSFIVEFDPITGVDTWISDITSDGPCETRGIAIDVNFMYLAGGGDGNVFVNLSGPFVIPGAGVEESMVCAIDRPTKTTQWVNYNDDLVNTAMYSEDIEADGLGNVYVTGCFQGNSSFNNATVPIAAIGGTDVFVTHFKDNGLYIGTVAATDNNDIAAFGVSYDVNGGIYVVGMMTSNGTFGALPVLGDDGGDDAFIAKLDCTPCDASFTYPKSNFCKAFDADPTTPATYDALSVFTSSPAGLSLNAVTGQITLASSNQGTYYITCTSPNLCTVMDTITVNDDCWEWMDGVSSVGKERGYSIAVDSTNQFVYVVGAFNDESAFPLLSGGQINNGTGNGFDDGFLAKYNFTGTQLWITNMGSSGDDEALGVCVGPLGNVYVTGYFELGMRLFSVAAAPSPATGNNGGQDQFIACYNAAGNLQWHQTSGGVANDNGQEIEANVNGLYVIGSYENAASFGLLNTETTFNTTINNYLIKYDFAGTEQWLVEMKSNQDDYNNASSFSESKFDLTTLNDSIYVIGEYKGNDLRFTSLLGALLPSPQLNNANGTENIFYAGFSDDGKITWVRQMQASSSDNFGYGIAADCEGVYIIGSLHSGDSLSGVSTPITGDHDNAFVAGLNKSNGDINWINTLGGNKSHVDVGKDIIADGYGNIAILGSFESSLFHAPDAAVVGANKSELFLSSYSNTGVFLWNQYSTGVNFDLGNGLANWGKDKYFVTGTYDDDITLPPFTSSTANSENLLVAGIAVTNPGSLLSCTPCVAPVITVCENDTTITSGPACSIILGDFTNGISYTDGCGLVTKTQNPIAGSVIPLGLDTVWLYVTDANGVVDSCSFELTVADSTNPTISCPGNVNISCPAVVNGIAPTATGDNCGIDSVSYVLTGATTGSGLNNASGTNFNDGVTTVTYTITDLSGNTATCNFTVSVNDVTNPTISCPANVNMPCPAVVNGIAPTAIGDNCGIDSVSYVLTGATTGGGLNDASGTTFNGGTTTVTYTVTDNSGNTTSCFFTVTVTDVINPTISCPGNVIINTSISSCDTIVSGLAPSGLGDNCGIDSVNYVLTGATLGSGLTDASGTTFNAGVTTVTYTITDLSGNTANCFFTVTVNDVVNPTITCSGNISVNPSVSSCDTTLVGLAPSGIGDNCGIDSVSYVLTGATLGGGLTDASGTTFNAGVTTVTYTATDLSGNTANCFFTVTVSDGINPTIGCPGNISVNPSVLSCDTVLIGIAPITPGDNCGIDSVSYVLTGATLGGGLNDASGSTFNAGITTVTYTVTDLAGNTANCFFTVTVSDGINPTLSCPGNVVLNTSVSSCDTVLSGIAPIAPGDNCGIDSVSYVLSGATLGNGLNDASGEAFGLGVTTVTYTVTDLSGNTATCNFTVTVNDNVNPTITCPTNVNTNTTAGLCTAVVSNIAPTAIGDNCGIDSVSYVLTGATLGSGLNDASGLTYNSGITTVTYTVTDLSGNTTTCNFVVVVIDNENPIMTCPTSLNANIDAGVCTAVINGIAPTGLGDNCGIDSVNYVLTGATLGSGLNDASGLTYNLGMTTVTYTITDLSGNSINCNFTVTISDNENPTMTCPSNMIVFTTTIGCDVVVNNIAPTGLSDNCGIDSVSYVLTGATIGSGLNDASGSTFNLGITTIMYSIVDNAGNSINCSFTITANDSVDPVITCPGDIVANNDVSSCDAIINNIAPVGFSDNCTVDTVYYNLTGVTSGSGPNDASGTTFNLGITTIAYIVIDESGNADTCSFTITINDNENPTITCPSNIVICDTNVSVPLPIFGDNCMVGSVINDFNLTNNASDIYPYGITTVNFTVTDTSGNSNTCSMTIESEIPPVANAGIDQILIGTTSTNFTGTTPSVGVGSWFNLSGYGNIFDDADPLSFVDQLETGENIFEWTVANGTCIDAIDDVIITVIPLKIPNGFSPNNDGDNDLFVIEGMHLLENEVTIFNRWGIELFYSKNYQNDWDGSSQSGSALPDDTYFYIVKIPGLNEELSGFVVLKR